MLRKKHRFTAVEMAKSLGVSGPAINGYEKADKLSLQRLREYCVVLEEERVLNALNQLEELL